MNETQPSQIDRSWTAWVWGVLILYLCTFVLEALSIYSINIFEIKTDWWLWLLIAEVLVIAICVRQQKRWKLPHALLAALSMSAMVYLWWLTWQQWNDYWVRWVIVFGGRWFIALGWLFVVLGALGAIASIVIYVRTEKRLRPFQWMKFWMVACLFIVTSELASSFVARNAVRQPLQLPQSLPDIDHERLHIVAIGGSTTLGFPYQPKVSFANVAADCLQKSTSLSCKVSNLAETGDNFRNSIERFHSLTTRPDVVVVYTGHNEFFYDNKLYTFEETLSRSKLDRWMRWSNIYCFYAIAIDHISTGRNETWGWLQEPQFSPLVRQARLASFQRQLRQFSEYAKQQNIPVIWMVPASGESTFQPNRTAPQHPLTSRAKKELLQAVEAAEKLMERQRWDLAIEQLELIRSKFGDLAEVEFLLGQCHERLQQWKSAIQHYDRAIDMDAYPARANSRYRQAVRDVASAFDMPCLDSREILRALTPHQILDRSVIHDNVHPCLRGHYELGVALADAIRELFDDQAPDSKDWPAFEEVITELDFQAEDLALAYRRTAHCLERLSRYRVEKVRRQLEAEQYEAWAEALTSGKLQPGDDGTESLTDSTRGVVFPQLP